MQRFENYHEARQVAEQLAAKSCLDIAIRAVKEYGKLGYNLSFAARNDSDYARAEIVKGTGEHRPTQVSQGMRCVNCLQMVVDLSELE